MYICTACDDRFYFEGAAASEERETNFLRNTYVETEGEGGETLEVEGLE